MSRNRTFIVCYQIGIDRGYSIRNTDVTFSGPLTTARVNEISDVLAAKNGTNRGNLVIMNMFELEEPDDQET